jgi:hypothetical protein
MVEALGVLVWEPTPTGTLFTLHGLVAVPPGVDPVLLSFFLDLSLRFGFTSVLNFFGTTGSIDITARMLTTPSF